MGGIRDWLKAVPGLRPAVIGARGVRKRAISYFRALAHDRDVERVRELRNVHAGRRAWILGTGPSLTRLDLSHLADEITFGVNGIFLLFDSLPWRPTYYLVEDCLVAEDNARTINDLHGPVKIFPRDLRYCLRPDEKTVYVEFVRGEHPGFPRFSRRCDRRVYWGGTVTYMALQLAHWMGCNPIYLLGMDMDYSLPDAAARRGSTIVSRGPDRNHFHPDYFGPGKRWHDPDVPRMIRCLARAARHLGERGVAVYNATRGGNLTVLPRADYEKLFAANQGALRPAAAHRDA